MLFYVVVVSCFFFFFPKPSRLMIQHSCLLKQEPLHSFLLINPIPKPPFTFAIKVAPVQLGLVYLQLKVLVLFICCYKGKSKNQCKNNKQCLRKTSCQGSESSEESCSSQHGFLDKRFFFFLSFAFSYKHLGLKTFIQAWKHSLWSQKEYVFINMYIVNGKSQNVK